ncbi:MAG: hypothetical protein ACREPM_14650 [Gemmatimonadaceae bacterium]
MSAPGRSAPPAPERLTPPLRPLGVAVAQPGLDVYLAALWRRRRLVIALPLALTTVVASLMLFSPRKYSARAAFIASEPQSMSGSLGALSSVAQQLGVPALSAVASSSATGSAQFYGDLLTSSTVLRAVVSTPFDARSPGVNGGIPFNGTLVDYVQPTGKTPTDNTLATMQALAKGLLTVSVDRPTGIVRFQVRTKNRRLSALIARRFLDLINEFNLERRQTQAGAERDFDLHRAQASLDSLHVAEAALADFRATNIDFSRSPRLATRESELQRRVSLAQQTYTTVAQRYELANIEAVRNTPVVTVIDAPEGLVEALPRHTIAIAFGTFVAAATAACALALFLERPTAAR